MPNCKDIVWTKYPFSDHVNSKHRPSVLISGKNSHGDIICLPITSSNVPNSYKLKAKDIEGKPDMSLLRLLTTSCISFEQPMTLDTSYIEKKPIATITEEAYMEIKKQFSKMDCS
jgi:hypothetical protein